MLINNLKYRRVAIGFSLFILICLFFGMIRKNSEPKRHDRRLPVVKTSQVVIKKDVKVLRVIGIVKAAQGIEISAPASNIVQIIHFSSGQTVQAGDVLVTLRNDDLKAIVKEDKVKYHLAQLNIERAQKLVGHGYVSKQDADLSVSNVDEAKARLEHDEAVLANSIIKAPFSGVLGISQVSVGQYVSAGQLIVSLQDLSKMYVEFFIPEKSSDLVHIDSGVKVISNQSTQHQWEGKTIALGAELDANTRSLAVRAELIPPYHNLKPGMFVNVELSLAENQDKLAVPQTAIVYNPYGNFVYLNQRGVVKQQYVNLGQTIDQYIIVEKGLKMGDEVVILGQQKLYDGANVDVKG